MGKFKFGIEPKEQMIRLIFSPFHNIDDVTDIPRIRFYFAEVYLFEKAPLIKHPLYRILHECNFVGALAKYRKLLVFSD